MSHFSRAFEKNATKMSLNGWEALNYIFLAQKFLSVIKSFGEKLKIMQRS